MKDKMRKNTEKELIDKLMRQDLSADERSILDENLSINKAIGNVWKKTTVRCADSEKEERILKGILSHIRRAKREDVKRRFRYNWWAAAVVLLLIYSSLFTWLALDKPTDTLWYVVNCGRQSMDSLLLPDGTFVVLNAGSKLTYPKEFSGKQREILLSGQAFFRVHPDKKHPFVVKTKQMNVTALGTAFEVFSFDEDTKVETVLLSGKIEVEPKNGQEKSEGKYILEPNQKLTYEKGITTVQTVNANNYSSWHVVGGLNFKNEKLSMILSRLEKWYGQKITYKDKSTGDVHFTFTVKDEPLKLILDFISNCNPTITYTTTSDGGYELSTKN